MIKLIDKQKIIIRYFNEGKSQRQISRELAVDRKTIRRYLREYEEKNNKLLDTAAGNNNALLIADIVEEQKYKIEKRKKVKLTDEIIEKINFYHTPVKSNLL